jgi:hypothetical protein
MGEIIDNIEEEYYEDDSEIQASVDIPAVGIDGMPTTGWRELATFKTKEEAIQWAQEHLGADENGMICVISEF